VYRKRYVSVSREGETSTGLPMWNNFAYRVRYTMCKT
jgi:hypothetical protein